MDKVDSPAQIETESPVEEKKVIDQLVQDTLPSDKGQVVTTEVKIEREI